MKELKLGTLSRIFSTSVVSELSGNQGAALFNSVVLESGILKHIDLNVLVGEFYDAALNILEKKYKNEYVYKNIITRKILLGRHSTNTAAMLTEFRVIGSKADAVVIPPLTREVKSRGLSRLQ